MFHAQCTHCNHVNPPAAKYCIRCGTQLLLTCPSCKALNDSTARACQNCAATLSDGGEPIHASLRAGRSAEMAVSGSVSSIEALSQMRSSETTRPNLPSEGDADAETGSGWAGSSPSTLAGSPAIPNVSKTSLTRRSKRVLIAFLIAVIAGGFSWYTYRYQIVDTAEQGAQRDDGIERDSRSSAANQNVLPVGAQNETKQRVESDSSAPCTEAVAALGLCSPERTPRKD
jgi:ribosomal protein L40E